MRIAILANYLPPGPIGGLEIQAPPGPIGGLELQAQGWAERLSASHQVTVIARRDPPELAARENRDGYTVVRTDVPLPRLRARVPLRLRRAGAFLPSRMPSPKRDMAEAVDLLESPPDLLLCFGTHSTGEAGANVARRLGIPAVVWIRHESDYQLRHSRARSRAVTRVRSQAFIRAWADAAAVIVQSETGRAGFLAELEHVAPDLVAALSGKLEVIGNGVDIPAFAPLRPNGPVLTVGRLVSGKGMETVIDACARLGRPLVIAGQGPEENALKAQAAELGADVQFTGFLGREAISTMYHQAFAVVLASRGEGLPNVVLEAMAHARPVVATPVGGVPDLIDDGVNGLLFPAGDSEALTAALKALEADPDQSGRIASAGYASVQRFSWDRVLPQLEAVLERYRRPA